jgi:Bacterial type III secretion protein (HrpB7)
MSDAMSGMKRTLKLVSSARQRRGRRIEEELLRQRRKLVEAQNLRGQARHAVDARRDDESRLQMRRGEVMGTAFSPHDLMLLDQLQDVLREKTRAAEREADAAHKKVLDEQAVVAETLQHLMRNRKRVEVIDERVVTIQRDASLQIEEAQAEEVEDAAVAPRANSAAGGRFPRG